MGTEQRTEAVSIYFPAGDFTQAITRHAAGQEQNYATHDEVAHLVADLREAGRTVTLYSLVTPEAREEHPAPGVRVVSLGAAGFTDRGRLASAVADDAAAVAIAHFPSVELLKALIGTDKRVLAVLASSFNVRRPRALWARYRTMSLLNSRRVELVANHCEPSTSQLADLGVARGKLIAWDVPHRYRPAEHAPKTLAPTSSEPRLAYAGSINASKGVGDVIEALALLRSEGMRAHCAFAGGGDVEPMRALARKLGVDEFVSFRGVIDNSEVFAGYRDADIAVVPSRPAFPEGFPLTMFEAIASRTPIACSDHPMFRPVMKDGETAVVFPAGDARALAAAVRRLLASPPLYAKLSQAAVATWTAMERTADWRTLLRTWVIEGRDAPWIQRNMMAARREA